jgi:hypothetical protein
MSARKPCRAWAAARRKHIRPGRAVIIDFEHDPNCLIYSAARVCTCDPIRVILDENGKELARVESAGPFDPLELLEVTR